MKKKEPPKVGKCGHKVWRIGQHGQVSYPRIIPANPQSPRQTNVREIWAAVSARWSLITQEQRDCWCAAAAKHNCRRRLGQTGPLAGPQLFQAINTTLEYYGRKQLDLPPPQPVFPRPAISAMQITNGPGGIRILLTCAHDPGDHTIVSASFPQSARKKVWTDCRFIGFCPAAVGGSADVTALYRATFGVPFIGSKVFLEAKQMINGWEDKPRKFSALVPPPG